MSRVHERMGVGHSNRLRSLAGGSFTSAGHGGSLALDPDVNGCWRLYS